MATITIRATSFCVGGGHVVIDITGDRQKTVEIPLEELRSSVGDDDVEKFVKIISKLAKIGRTNAQFKTLLQSGIAVTV